MKALGSVGGERALRGLEYAGRPQHHPATRINRTEHKEGRDHRGGRSEARLGHQMNAGTVLQGMGDQTDFEQVERDQLAAIGQLAACAGAKAEAEAVDLTG